MALPGPPWLASVARVARDGPDPDALALRLAPAFGPGRVDGLRRLSGGASRETWTFDLVGPDGTTHPLVLRRDPGGNAIGTTERSTEYALFEAAAASGVPVPSVRVLLADDDGLGPGFVMDRVDGETIPRRILRDDAYAAVRPKLAAQCGAIAARIHSISPDALPKLAVHTPVAQVEQFLSLFDSFGEPHPAFELAARWLVQHAPPGPTTPGLVHGDFRNGNFIVGSDGIRAVLDWELAHLGDPVEDLGWLCVKSWRFGNADRLVGGFGDLADLLDAYSDAGGANVEEATLRYWVVFGTLRWGLISVAQAFTHLSGMQRSVELATLGRRVAEMEWDILDLLDGGW
jgi:aminoglycoside phosphotransferase (APT) family kinase protein